MTTRLEILVGVLPSFPIEILQIVRGYELEEQAVGTFDQRCRVLREGDEIRITETGGRSCVFRINRISTRWIFFSAQSGYGGRGDFGKPLDTYILRRELSAQEVVFDGDESNENNLQPLLSLASGYKIFWRS